VCATQCALGFMSLIEEVKFIQMSIDLLGNLQTEFLLLGVEGFPSSYLSTRIFTAYQEESPTAKSCSLRGKKVATAHQISGSATLQLGALAGSGFITSILSA
jgi:hypothetical protein